MSLSSCCHSEDKLALGNMLSSRTANCLGGLRVVSGDNGSTPETSCCLYGRPIFFSKDSKSSPKAPALLRERHVVTWTSRCLRRTSNCDVKGWRRAARNAGDALTYPLRSGRGAAFDGRALEGAVGSSSSSAVHPHPRPAALAAPLSTLSPRACAAFGRAPDGLASVIPISCL